jgi:cyclopropane-fatty-acyl-phospholipid synthase
VDVATTLAPLVDIVLGSPPPIGVEFWDGSVTAPAPDAPDVGTLIVRSPDAVRRIAWSPDELGLGRAYVAGELDVGGRAAVGGSGDFVQVLELVTAALGRRQRSRRVDPSAVVRALAAARKLGVLGRPLPPPPEEAHLRGWRHSIRRDAGAIHHHYDTGNDFYRIVLGPSLTYSCARFVDASSTLDEAQAAKHDLVARKLGLADVGAGVEAAASDRPRRLLDVGCGWGSMAIHAASTYGVDVVGITISQEQAKLARERVDAAGVGDRVEIRLQDYRELGDERFDAISSIGMSEHVGAAKLDGYFAILADALVPRGRMLNHAITSVGGSKLGRRSFTGRYVFPDGELIDVGDVVLAMERAGLEVRDVESLREHYARTLRAWVANLEAGWDDAVAAADVAKARIWRLYMAGAAVGFTDGGLSIHQVLGVVPDDTGYAAMPATRRDWV